MFGFWILLSGEFSVILLASGVIFSLIVAAMCHDMFIGKANLKIETRRVLRFFKYMPWLLWQIVLSNVDVAYRTLHPRMPIDPGVIRFKTDVKTDMGIVTLSNSITLTPGTVTIKAGKDEFLVHAITRKAADSLIDGGEMQKKVKAIEGDECV